MSNFDVGSMREDYDTGGIDEQALPDEPFSVFAQWFEAAIDAGEAQPNAMVVATVGDDGKPSARAVLLKHHGTDGFVFYTNYRGRKGRELETNPHAALCFVWPGMHRQVRIEGVAERVDTAMSEAYFRSRPIGARIAAVASRQSEVVASRAVLEERWEEARHESGEDPESPPYWGGFRVRPDTIEFWQGRRDRLHDRIRYRRVGSDWVKERLSP